MSIGEKNTRPFNIIRKGCDPLAALNNIIPSAFNKTIFGVTLGAGKIKGVKLTLIKGKPELTSMITAPIADIPLSNIQELSEGIKTTFAHLDYRGGEVITTLEPREVVTRLLTMPDMTPEELETAVYYEARNVLPMDVDESIISYAPVTLPGTNPPKLQVLLTATPRDKVYLFHQAFQLAGVKITAIDIQPVALWRLARGWCKQPGVSYGILHAEGDTAHLVVVRDNLLNYTRLLTMANGFPVDRESYLSIEVAKTLEIYAYQQPDHPVEQLIITGEDASISLLETLRTELGMVVEEGVFKMAIDRTYAMALGLALREVRDGVI